MNIMLREEKPGGQIHTFQRQLQGLKGEYE